MKNTGLELLNSFLQDVPNHKLWPPLNNYSLFVFGSEYSSQRYFKEGIYTNSAEHSILNIGSKTDTTVYLPESSLRYCAHDVFLRYLKDGDVLIKFENEFYKNFPSVDIFYHEYTYKKIADEDIDLLGRIVIKAFDLIWSSNAWSYFSLAFDKDICMDCILKAGLPLSKEQLDDLWDIATVSISRSFDKDQEIQVLKSMSEGNNFEKIVEGCQYFYATYKDVQSLEESLRRLKETYGSITDPISAKNRLLEIGQEENQKKVTYDNWLTNLSIEQRRVAQYMQSVMRIRDHRKNFFAKMFVVAWRIAERMCNDAGITQVHIKNILPLQELTKGIGF